MEPERNEIESLQRTMKDGQCARIPGHMFRRAFPCGFPSIYATHEQSFLSKQIGSAYGTWRVKQDMFEDIYTISRHAADESGRIHYVDPDREHYYRKTPDGYFERNKAEFRRDSD